jgi:Uma2 family endonuclease
MDGVVAERDILSIDDERVRLPRSAFAHDGFRAWVQSDRFPDKELRATFVRGEVLLEMSPESIETHNKVKTELTRVLAQIVLDRDLGELYADRALLTNEAAVLSCEPDLTFASWQALEQGRVTLVEKANRDGDFVEIVGTPDLVAEIVSDSSVRKDLTLLRDGYSRAGVAEYWVIDARGAEIEFQILQLGDGNYRASASSGERQESRVLASCFELTRTRNRVGRWRYLLEAY